MVTEDEVWTCSVRAPANIALVKYWGKRDTKLNLPLNDSISLTIDALIAETTIAASQVWEKDSVTINGKEMDCGENSRVYRVFQAVRQFLEAKTERHDWEQRNDKPQSSMRFKVLSRTNFPVEAGLASSAAGFAALAYCFKALFDLSEEEASQLARIGSGSAIRSLHGGLVRWKRGIRDDGVDSVAVRVFSPKRWLSLRALIFVVSAEKKETGSTIGMQTTVETSKMLPARVARCDKMIERMQKAFAKRNFPALARLVMNDSNNFHACCMDTVPPLKYLNEASAKIMKMVDSFNTQMKRVSAAYTFDAGPNACIYLEKRNVPAFIEEATHWLSFAPSAEKTVEEILGKPIEPHSDAIIEEPMSPIQSPASDFSFTDALASHALLGATDETPPLILDLIYSTVGAEPCVIHHQKNSGY